MVISDQLTFLWVFDPSRDAPAGFVRSAAGSVRYEETNTWFRCGGNRYVVGLMAARNDSGILVAGGAAVPEEPYHPVETDELNHIAYNIVCNDPLPSSASPLSVDEAISKALSIVASKRH
jgi:hypothetical protein